VVQPKIEWEKIGDVAVFYLEGKDFSNEISIVENQIRSVITQGREVKFILEISKFEWISTPELSKLINCLIISRNRGGDLKVAGTTRNVYEVMEIIEILQVLESYNSVREAVKSFNYKKEAK
jgi:anti-anti-sigma regulatory factor